MDGSRLPRSCSFVLLLAVGLIAGAGAPPAAAQTCGDLIWEDQEWCGQDAYYVTGRTEMDHTCYVDLIDFALFAADFASMGFGLSGDFDRNEVVTLHDFAIFVGSWDQPVPGCTPWIPYFDGCQGTIRLSFDWFDPENDLDTIVLAPGAEYIAYVVVENCEDMHALGWSCLASPNLDLQSWGHLSDLEIQQVGAFQMGLDAGAHFAGELYFRVLDGNPAWLRLQGGASPAYALRWSQFPPGRKMHFDTIAHAGINGPAPPDSNGCPSDVGEIVDLSRAADPLRLRCAPNPGVSGTTLRFELPAPGRVELVVRDPAGREVRSLAAGMRPAGPQTLTWDGADATGRPVAAGIYFLHLRAGETEALRRVAIAR
jgi:hypothetical protein